MERKSSPGRTGRRPGPNQTRAAILDAARAAFAERGYDGVSIRAVAREAGVDPALVHRFYGSKEQLFVAAMALPISPSQIVETLLADGVEGLGERLVRTVLGLFDAPDAFAPILALIRGAVSNERAAAMLREFLAREVLGRLAAAASPDRPELRASLAGSQIIGLAMARAVVGVPPLATTDRETVAACVGPTIQRYLTGALATG
ncbi:MAG TPA: TetR family transcriptional regulator [Solirubrobacteraceae bacterium]|nr:TetR family transcriptional regulator [Solirubrobacteraceae bacterium]